jgi:hypothetical protein
LPTTHADGTGIEPVSPEPVQDIPPSWQYIPPPWEPASPQDVLPVGYHAHAGVPVRRSARRGRWVAAAMAVIVAGAGVAFFLHGRQANSQPSSLPPGSGASSDSAALGLELQQIVVQSTDINGGATSRLIPEGDKVSGQVTLDGCGYAFTSESKRVARRQYELVDTAGHSTGIGNEVVAYDNAPDATLALNQWRAALAKCPNTPQHSSVAGTPDLTYAVLSRTADSSALPVKTNETCVLRVSGQGHTVYLYAIYQQHGRFLDGAYVIRAGSPTIADKAVGTRLATFTGGRLSALPS